MLSDRGSVSVDERTNTLMVQDTAERLRTSAAWCSCSTCRSAGADRGAHRRRQRHVRARSRRAASASPRPPRPTAICCPCPAPPPAPIRSSAHRPAPRRLTGSSLLTAAPLANRYQVNLPAANVNGSIGISLLSGSHLLDLELSAAQNDGKSETISSPRVITANQKQATIMQGVEIPYQESASSGATTTQFKNAVLSLKVTPLITPDNRVVLDIDVSDDTVGANVTSATGGSVPSIDTRQIVTQVLVNDGQTVVLGGILETTKSKSATRCRSSPIFRCWAICSRARSTSTTRPSCLIFITPKICARARRFIERRRYRKERRRGAAPDSGARRPPPATNFWATLVD
jgi:type IV pilus assembly protein PilQ